MRPARAATDLTLGAATAPRETSADCSITVNANKTVSVAFVVTCSANIGDACTSTANNCGRTSAGKVQCNGSCSANPPADCNPSASYCSGTVCTPCSDNQGDSCTSAPNNCGATSQGKIQCDGTCSAKPPAACDLSTSYLQRHRLHALCGQPGRFVPRRPRNNCGATSQGKIQCDGTCSAKPPAACDLSTFVLQRHRLHALFRTTREIRARRPRTTAALPVRARFSATAPVSAKPPAECDLSTSYCSGTVCTPCSDNQGDSCTSAPNNCGATSQGKIQCDGTCSAKPPAACDLNTSYCSGTVCTPCADNQGDSCTSAPNNCGATSQGKIQCDGTCSAKPPAACDLSTSVLQRPPSARRVRTRRETRACRPPNNCGAYQSGHDSVRRHLFGETTRRMRSEHIVLQRHRLHALFGQPGRFRARRPRTTAALPVRARFSATAPVRRNHPQRAI